MKRTEMITRLTTVGFNATELSRMSNTNLHATYVTARPLLEKNSEELSRVVDRERKRGQRRRAEIAAEQQNRQAIEGYHQWSQSNLPRPIVARGADAYRTMEQNPDVLFVSEELRKAKTELRKAEHDVVRKGGPERLSNVERARLKVRCWEAQMQEVSK